ncbi:MULTISPECIES: hypothetical protein [Corallococcus]|uniref:hypothetical protein n=1 Tax=Corallococcus TaxID=83461 RepID=UPI0011C442A2|nr:MULTISPECIES: hypothetical protein [Corallococcus]
MKGLVLALGCLSVACSDPDVCNHDYDSVTYTVTENTCGPSAAGTLRVFSEEDSCEAYAEMDEGLGLPTDVNPRMPSSRLSSGESYLGRELWGLNYSRFDSDGGEARPYLSRSCNFTDRESSGRKLLCRDIVDTNPQTPQPECTAVLTRQ